MPIEQMTHADLLAAQRELMAKARAARNEGDLDLACVVSGLKNTSAFGTSARRLTSLSLTRNKSPRR